MRDTVKNMIGAKAASFCVNVLMTLTNVCLMGRPKCGTGGRVHLERWTGGNKKMAFKVGDKVRFKCNGDQWAYMKEMKIQVVNNDGTYDVIGKNKHLKREYGTELCCAVRIKECNLERDLDGRK